MKKGACGMDENVKLPIGIESFQKIRTEGFYYVDKTALIEQLLDNWSEVNLFTRPRRFGKTLNMSMLKSFFEIGTDKSLFGGLYISKNERLCSEYMGKFPVIFVTLKGVEGFSFEEARDRFAYIIGNEIGRFRFLLESKSLPEADKERFAALDRFRDGLSEMDGMTLAAALKILSELLCKHYGQKAVILIDEYDVPLDKAFQNGYYNEMVSLIRVIFGDALKTNEYLQFAVLTGCMRISRESIFTGLNNFKVLSITDLRFNEQFGFTDEEVKKLFSYYGLESRLTDTKAWYDGYRFGDKDIYCPWDVINFAYDLRADIKQRPRAYWINTSGNGLLRRLIEKANVTTKNDIERLVAGENIEKEIHQELTYNEIEDSIDNIWSVLFTTGYLTMTEETDNGTYKLRIPNEELRMVYRKQVLEWINKFIQKEAEGDKLDILWAAFAAGDAETIEKYITNMLTCSISVFDVKGDDIRRESSYHMIVMALLAANPDWNTRSNVEAGEGFADIVVELDNPDAGAIVELKYVRNFIGMEASCKNAMTQIKDKHYYEYLENEGREDIMLYGISFCKKRCRVMVEKL